MLTNPPSSRRIFGFGFFLCLFLLPHTGWAQDEEIPVPVMNMLYDEAPAMIAQLEPLVEGCWSQIVATADIPLLNDQLRKKCKRLEELLDFWRKVADNSGPTGNILAEIQKPLAPPPAPPDDKKMPPDMHKIMKDYAAWIAAHRKFEAEHEAFAQEVKEVWENS